MRCRRWRDRRPSADGDGARRAAGRAVGAGAGGHDGAPRLATSPNTPVPRPRGSKWSSTGTSTIHVDDDGVGVEPVPPRAGDGLRNLHQRAGARGGRVSSVPVSQRACTSSGRFRWRSIVDLGRSSSRDPSADRSTCKSDEPRRLLTDLSGGAGAARHLVGCSRREDLLDIGCCGPGTICGDHEHRVGRPSQELACGDEPMAAPGPAFTRTTNSKS